MRSLSVVLVLLTVVMLPIVRAADHTATLVRVAVEFNPADLPRSPGYHVIQLRLGLDDKWSAFPCGIYLPPAFFHGDDRWPVVVGLHNKVSIGTDRPETLSDESLGFFLAHDRFDHRATGTRPVKPIWLCRDAPFVGLVPECPGGHLWEDPEMASAIRLLIDRVIGVCRGDRDRVYLTGFSYGGSSTWVVASAMPDVFAAIAPIDGRATTRPVDTVTRLRRTAVYLVVGGSDRDFLPEAKRMRDALAALPHPDFVSRIVPGGNHFCYSTIYTDPAFWDWMLAQRRDPAWRELIHRSQIDRWVAAMPRLG